MRSGENLLFSEPSEQEVMQRRLSTVDERVEELLSQSLPEALRGNKSKKAAYCDPYLGLGLLIENHHVPKSRHQLSTDIRTVNVRRIFFNVRDHSYKLLPPEKGDIYTFGWHKSGEDEAHDPWETRFQDEARDPTIAIVEFQEIILDGQFKPITHRDILPK
jgi:hypothetical protein